MSLYPRFPVFTTSCRKSASSIFFLSFIPGVAVFVLLGRMIRKFSSFYCPYPLGLNLRFFFFFPNLFNRPIS